MFEIDSNKELYTRVDFTFEELLFERYLSMRELVNKLENIKYKCDDTLGNSKEFKQGFLAGVKVMSSIFLDI